MIFIENEKNKVRVHINQSQKDQLDNSVEKTGIDEKTLMDEAFKLFLERYEYILRQDPYYPIAEGVHYKDIENQQCTVTVDLSHSPGNAIARFLTNTLSLNVVSLGYVTRKALSLLFEGKPIEKKLHI